MRVLFATPEMDDFVRVGGLSAVSAALPRAIRTFSDIRVVLPGYRAAMAAFNALEPIGRCPALAGLPACEVARTSTHDGLPVYVVVCPELFDREGTPYGDARGRDWADNEGRFARYASASALLARGEVDPNWQA